MRVRGASGTMGAARARCAATRLRDGRVLVTGGGDGMRLTEQDRLCIPVPLYHCFGMVLGVLAAVTHGATIVFPAPVYDPLSTLQAVQEEKCTALHGVPTMFVTELDHPDFASFDLSALRTGIIAGAPCPEELMKRIIGDMHMDNVLIGYGQTEVSPINHMTLPEDSFENRTQTVGRPIPHIDMVPGDGQPFFFDEQIIERLNVRRQALAIVGLPRTLLDDAPDRRLVEGQEFVTANPIADHLRVCGDVFPGALHVVVEIDGKRWQEEERYQSTDFDYGDPDNPKHDAMIERIERRLGLTSLSYQRLDDLVAAIGMPKEKLCTYCWDGAEPCGGCGKE